MKPKQNHFEESLGQLRIIPLKFLTLKVSKNVSKLRAVVAKNRAGKKLRSPIIKFHSNFESPIQSEYAGKFSDQSDDTSHFYRTRKLDDGFLGEKSSSWNYFSSFGK
jgi:hypothetical protein